MKSILAVAFGGAVGALARYGAGRLVALVVADGFPWATWAVNLVGCFVIGMAVPLIGGWDAPAEARLFFVVGVLGSFTTFSTYSLDTLGLLADGHVGWALLNAVGSVVLGLVFVWVGRQTALFLLEST